MYTAGAFSILDVPGAVETIPLGINDAGDIVSAGSMPVPFSEIAVGELDASLVTVNVPLAEPMAVGANCN